MSYRYNKTNPPESGYLLFQISIADYLLAAGDEVAQCLAFQESVGEKSQVSNLLECFILRCKCLDISLVHRISGIFGLTCSSLGILSSLLLLIGSILGLAGLYDLRISICHGLLRLNLSFLRIKNL